MSWFKKNLIVFLIVFPYSMAFENIQQTMIKGELTPA